MKSLRDNQQIVETILIEIRPNVLKEYSLTPMRVKGNLKPPPCPRSINAFKYENGKYWRIDAEVH